MANLYLQVVIRFACEFVDSELYLEVCGWENELCFGAANFTTRFHVVVVK